MAWTDAARAAAAEARRRHLSNELSSARDAEFKARVGVLRAKQFNGPKQWGSRPGWMARRMAAEANVTKAIETHKAAVNALNKIGKKFYGR